MGSLPKYDAAAALALGAALRDAGHHPSTVAAALTQSRLRAGARAKFGSRVDRMLFTQTGLEQATRMDVASHHATRFADAGAIHVADLGCGIGGDAIALAEKGLAVVAVDHDELVAAVAKINLAPFDRARVRCADALSLDLSAMDGVWLDPSRRTHQGRRRHDPRAATPSWRHVLEVAQRSPAAGAKLAPGLPHELIPDHAEAQWTSVDGKLVEAVVWWGRLARAAVRRSATVLTSGDEAHATELTWPDANPPRVEVGPVSEYLVEPDDAVLRAGLVGPLAQQIGAWAIDPAIAYLCTDVAVVTRLGTTYQVLDCWPFSVKALRARLRDLDVGSLTIKKRGSAVVPEQLRGQLRLRGGSAATIVLTRVAGAPQVLLVNRCV